MQRPALPGFALSAGMLWLLAGALYKLFDGSPNDLPEIVKEMSPLSSWETMRAAIIVELAVVGLVIAKPRLGWLFLCGAFATFLAILFPLVQAGESSCGCFGSNVTIAPQTMMGIDGGLLLLILFSRPWRMAKESGLGWSGYLPLLAAAIVGPWMKLEAPQLPNLKKPASIQAPAGDTELGTPPAGTDPSLTEGMVDATTEKGAEAAEGAIAAMNALTGEGDANEQPEASEEEVEVEEPIIEEFEPEAVAMPEFYELRPDTWEGQPIDATDIYQFADQSQGAILPNSHVVVYRQTCEVCKAHLEELWEEAQNDPTKWSGERQLVLIRVIENKDATEQNLIEVIPEPSQKVSLPALKRGYGIKTPLAFDVDEAFMVQNVEDLSKH